MNYKPIPIGVENFKDIIDKGYYYVDKTLFIKDILDNKSYVNLYTRPRRFGKTLNMSMLKYYFEKSDEDTSYLFDGLNISKQDKKYKGYQGQYPVISISLKSMKQPKYEEAFSEFKSIIANEIWRHKELLNSDILMPISRKKLEMICNDTADNTVYKTALRLLSDCLCAVYNKKVIILIDEYDVPLESAYFRGYYDEMVNLIRSVFESALKTNNSLEFGVLTGCLRISKESIFTGLNNLKINSITTLDYSEYFGFTEKEVKTIADIYGISSRFDDIKDWYDGYLFGNTEIYNPWSIINFISDAKSDPDTIIKPYWSNTSSNDIIHKLITEGDEDIKDTVENLVNGGMISKPLYEDITYRNINVNSDYIWSFLLYTGYLKAVRIYLSGNTLYADMVIPNREVTSIYENTIMQWFNEKIVSTSRDELFSAVISGNTLQFEDILLDWLEDTISYYDTKENYYHGFLAGLLSGFKGYKTESNRENGIGRSDIILLEQRRHKLAVIIEIKVADEFSQLSQKCDDALIQIEEKQYDMQLKRDCYQQIIKYGVAFYKKSCMIKLSV